MRFSSASVFGREMLLGALETIGDAARQEAHSWRRAARVVAW